MVVSILKILVSLSVFAFAVWFPIGLYLFWEKRNTSQQQIWRKKPAAVAYQRFGVGSLHQFDWYLGRQSTVSVKSIPEICEWLLDCKFIHDQALFAHPDMWQHPVDFEISRQGDCEDHALWAWRKCHDLGVEAEFVVGKMLLGNGNWGDHTWVVLKDKKGSYTLETTAKKLELFHVMPVQARRHYRPYYGMDTKLHSFVYQRSVKP